TWSADPVWIEVSAPAGALGAPTSDLVARVDDPAFETPAAGLRPVPRPDAGATVGAAFFRAVDRAEPGSASAARRPPFLATASARVASVPATGLPAFSLGAFRAGVFFAAFLAPLAGAAFFAAAALPGAPFAGTAFAVLLADAALVALFAGAALVAFVALFAGAAFVALFAGAAFVALFAGAASPAAVAGAAFAALFAGAALVALFADVVRDGLVFLAEALFAGVAFAAADRSSAGAPALAAVFRAAALRPFEAGAAPTAGSVSGGLAFLAALRFAGLAFLAASVFAVETALRRDPACAATAALRRPDPACAAITVLRPDPDRLAELGSGSIRAVATAFAAVAVEAEPRTAEPAAGVARPAPTSPAAPSATRPGRADSVGAAAADLFLRSLAPTGPVARAGFPAGPVRFDPEGLRLDVVAVFWTGPATRPARPVSARRRVRSRVGSGLGPAARVPGAPAAAGAFRVMLARSAITFPHVQNGRAAGRRALRRLARIRNVKTSDNMPHRFRPFRH
ncbi:MAG TPA: hypothetical protein VK659_29130, partial [Asanoa sp.]|nr:hypothetical protein [Asanoa sp.]